MRLQTCVLLIAAATVATMLAAAPGMAQSSQPKVRSNPIDPITGYPIPPGRKDVRARTSVVPQVGLILGSGLGGYADGLGKAAIFVVLCGGQVGRVFLEQT